MKHNFRVKKTTSTHLLEELPEYFAGYIADLPKKIKEDGKEEVYKKLKSFIDMSRNFEELLSKEEVTIFRENFQKQVIPYTQKSEFCKYCHDKPRGYAGDFMAMEMIWNGRTKLSYKSRGSSEIGRILNDFTMESDNCKSNEYRVHYLENILHGYKDSMIASIGCGSVIELQELHKKKV